MFARLGIGARLFLAFLGITALSLAPGLAGWLIVRQVADSQLLMTERALPAVAATQNTAKASTRLLGAAPALIAAETNEERGRQAADISALTKEIQQSVADAAFSAADQETVRRLSQTVEALVSNLSAQNRLVSERIEIKKQFDQSSEQAIAAATAIVDLSETLVSNASAQSSAVVANLYGLVDSPERGQETYNALDSLIEQDIFLLDRMWELRLRSSQIGLLLNRLPRASDESDVSDIASNYRQQLRVVSRRVASIDDPVRQKQAQQQLSVLQRVSANSPWDLGLFDKRIRLLGIARELERLGADNQQLAARLGGIAQDMLASSQDFAASTAKDSQQALKAGLYVLVVTSLIAVVLSSLIVWLYVERGVVRQLTAVSTAMRRLTQGDLNVEMKEEGAPELRSLAAAVVAFRNESQHRRNLETEREKTNEELRRHREELRELVDERTRQLREVNEDLRREAERHAAARYQAEMASRAKSSFLATMSHEIRTPMTGMLGMLRILQDGKLTAKQRKQLVAASGSGEALLGILNSILDYSKIESGKIMIDRQPFDFRGVLQGIVDFMQPSAAAKGLVLSFDVDAHIGKWHEGDAGKLRQILFNLIGNAVKFTEAGSVRISARLLEAAGAIEHIVIDVADTGIGIAGPDIENIFRAFTQTDASITRRYGGTGLGLSISEGLAEAMDGRISVQSQPGMGSTFTLHLRLAAVPAAPSRAAARATTSKSDASRCVLIVEDDEATRAVVAHFTSDLGHRVTTAVDAYEAISAVAASPPDVVLMDMSLPGMDGIAAARAIRETVPDLRIIAMSAHVFESEIEHYLKSGMDAYVAKPLTPESLAAVILRAEGDLPARKPVSDLDAAAFATDVKLLRPERMASLLDIVEKTIPPRLAELKTAASRRNFSQMAKTAHAAFSAASSVGFNRLAASLSSVEKAAQSRDIKKARKQIAVCSDQYDLALSEARKALNGKPSAEVD